MKITFHGAAQNTTGSMHLIEVNGSRVLLDCGLFQGHRKEAFERNRNLPFDPKSIDTLILSHAHIDHSGNVPTLVKNGFRGRVFCTPATRDLCDIMLRDSAYLQTRDVEYVNKRRARQGKNLFEPLYEPSDIDPALEQFRTVAYDTDFEVGDGVTARFHDAGHILGSALTTIDFKRDGTTKRLLYTGDLGRPGMPILRDPMVVSDVDWLITESTYGNRIHPPKEDVKGRLKAFIEDIEMQNARFVIPAFSVGRTQVLVYYLREIYDEGRVAGAPVFVDSPLSSKASEVHMQHPECYDDNAMDVFMDGDKPFHFQGLKYITDVEDSKKLNEMEGPVVIISASGMCEGGRILHHLKHTVENPTGIILIVGYQAEHTLGRRLVERVNPVKIFGEEYRLRARVHTINALSAHADRREMMDYYEKMGLGLERVFCVHGEEEQTSSLAEILRGKGVRNVEIPERGQTFEV